MLFGVAAFWHAARALAQQLPPAEEAPKDDPRKGPRLEYKRGPAQCLAENDFRSEVAIALDGVDHLATDSPDLVQVRFERNAGGGFKATIVHTNALGEQSAPKVLTYYNCEILGRHAGWWVSRLVPPAPDPPPPPPCPATPAPPCAPCPACQECGRARPSIPCPLPPTPPPWRMDLSVGVGAYAMMTAFLSADVGPAVGLTGSVAGEIFSLNAELRLVIPSRAHARATIPGLTPNYPVDFDLSQVSGLLVPCARYKFLLACGVGQISALMMQSSVSGLMVASFGLGPRLGFEVPFAERFAAFAFGEVLFNPAPASFSFILPDPNYPEEPPANTRWTQPVASGFFGAGVSIKFR